MLARRKKSRNLVWKGEILSFEKPPAIAWF